MLTKNEKRVLRLLLTAFDKQYSINNVAKECNLFPNGAYKILKKFEEEGILKAKHIANIKSYSINFDDEKTDNILELALMPKLEGRIKYRLEDLKGLKGITKSCILFGSYIDLKKEPHDLDILFVIDRNNFKQYKKKLADIKDTVPAKIHDVLQTEEDFKSNIENKDKVILQILRTGIIFWGIKTIIKVIKNFYQRENKPIETIKVKN
ncbi:hypothetical protein HYX00_01770 [Candidatus Woesearchaeota archaeon]|nr:hypothetical protein [Candidatus Woesearchaeota archaeon]